MFPLSIRPLRLAALALGCSLSLLPAQEAPPLNLLPDAASAAARFKGTPEDIVITPGADGVAVMIPPGPAGYPGVQFKAESGLFDLSKYGHVEAKVVNTGAKVITFALRVDGNGPWQENPWNTESVSIKPGETGTVSTIFGYQYGKKKGYALNTKEIAQLYLFTSKSNVAQSFKIESLQAGGPAGEKPTVDPKDVRVKPKDGQLLGNAEVVNTVSGKGGTSATLEGGTFKVKTPGKTAAGVATLAPTVGRWDLRDYLEMRLKVKNDGSAPVTPRAQVLSNGGKSDLITASAPLAPGAETELVVPFRSGTPWQHEVKTSGNQVTNDTVAGVMISTEPSDAETALAISAVTAAEPVEVLPDWLGKRPPVTECDWKLTFEDNFDAAKIDESVWNIYTANFWDKKTAFSKDNLVLGNGMVRLRYEKKATHENDDPKKPVFPYTSGFLDTYGKWVQRYGYWEARTKAPKAQGLWPGFWLMPDRGVAFAKEQWKRANTGNGAMEFDIMEGLTRWGKNRYNIAMHYDGYGKDHKATGSQNTYGVPDKDGFITTGLLWTPGVAVFYCQGKEVLRWENPRISNVESYPIFYLPQGGWDNSPIDDKELPDDFVVDYIRVWQRSDLASPVDGKKASAPEEKKPEGEKPATP